MEKFAVDLDKVLDDFEFNEEQAVRSAPYIREDLPAKKYQRPSFQRINLADADFSPSKQTSAPISFSYDYPEEIKPVNLATPLICDLSKQAEYENDSPEGVDEADEERVSDVRPEISIEWIVPEAIPDLLDNEINETLAAGALKLPDITETGGDNLPEPDLVGSNSIQQCALEVTTDSEFPKERVDSDAESDSSEEAASRNYTSQIEISGQNANDNILVIVNTNEEPDEETEDCTSLLLTNGIANSALNLSDSEEEEISVTTENIMAVNLEGNESQTEELVITSSPVEEEFCISEEMAAEEMTERLTDSVEEAEIPLQEDEEDVEPIQFVEDTNMSEEDLEMYLEKLEAEQTETREEPKSVLQKDVPVASPSEEIPRETLQRPKSLDLNLEPQQEIHVDSPAVLSDSNHAETRDSEFSESEESVAGTSSNASQPDDDQYKDDMRELDKIWPALSEAERRLGKVTPFWVPDADALNCMQCAVKFTVIKRRHHCRACGRVLCSKCCDMRASIEYLRNQEHRVCELCFRTLTKVMMYEETDSEAENSPRRRPNPNNPMEYCSTVPPPLQASPSSSQAPPSVLVPVLKREGAIRPRDPQRKVIFSDGIRPGGDLTDLDEPPPPRVQKISPKRIGTPPGSVVPSPVRMIPPLDPSSQSFMLEHCLPPLCVYPRGGKLTYLEPLPLEDMVKRLKDPNLPPLYFALNRHLVSSLKIVFKECCMGKECWVFSTQGMAAVGQDEIVVLLETTGHENEPVPVEIFMQLHYIYQSAEKGTSVGELGYWSVKQSTFLGSRQLGGFLFVRPTFQCVQNIPCPNPPYLVGVLIHRLELPWARQFPLRLMLRLGAEFKYYPCSFVSVRDREPVYYEIGQTIMKLLADFRDYTYTLPVVRGLKIHIEAQQTSVLIPRNRYDQVVRALNNSNTPVLALAGSFSRDADAHLVCMQSKGDEVTYSTTAINIHDKPREVTGASFVVFNASLKTTEGVLAKSKLVEDGVMVEISADMMIALRGKMRACEDWSVQYGAAGEDVIQVAWCADDKDFNMGVRSGIDHTPLDGKPSMRVHNGTDYGTRFIRWTEVFIIKCEDGVTSAKIGDPLEVKRLSENIARATCTALTKADLLDLLATSNITCFSLRATIAPEVVCYDAGSNGEKLAPVFMKSLDNELIPVLHKATAGTNDATAILELVFHILHQ